MKIYLNFIVIFVLEILKTAKTMAMNNKESNKNSKAIEFDSGENIKKRWYYAVGAGALAGFANGLFGGGGGMIIVPLLIFLLKFPPKVAHATAILIILPLSILSGIFYIVFGKLEIFTLLSAGGGVIAGGALGALLLNKLSSKWVVIVFSVAMAAAGIKMLFF